LSLATYLRVFFEYPALQLSDFQYIMAGWIEPEVFLVVSILWPVVLVGFGLYDGNRNHSRQNELLNCLLALGTAILLLAVVLFLTYRETSRLLFVFFFIINLILLMGWRIIFFQLSSFRRRNVYAETKKVLILGAGEVGEQVASELSKFAERHIKIVGFLDDDPQKKGTDISGYPVLGDLDQIVSISKNTRIRHAIIALPLQAHRRLIKTARRLQEIGVHVYVIPDLFALSFPNLTLDGFGGIPVLDLGKQGIQERQRTLKRIFDIIIALVNVIFFSPILIVLGILIKLDSPGPVFYKQKRIGEYGRPFLIIKFRSMWVDADERTHEEYVTRLIRENLSQEQISRNEGKSLKMEKDPRITRIGKFLRKTSLDELPQLFNVLRGDMSIVGPRPPLPYEINVYQDWHMRRLEAPPGITGLWQVKARNQVSFDEMVRLDLEYINNYSFWLDIKLMLQTPLKIISTKGAG